MIDSFLQLPDIVMGPRICVVIRTLNLLPGPTDRNFQCSYIAFFICILMFDTFHAFACVGTAGNGKNAQYLRI